jgi:hypothetical protein
MPLTKSFQSLSEASFPCSALGDGAEYRAKVIPNAAMLNASH